MDLNADVARVHRLAAARHPPASIGLETVVLGRGALDSLAAEVDRVATSERLVMLEDATPMRLAAQQQLKPAVAGLLRQVGAVERVVLGAPDGTVRVDAHTLAAAADAAAGAGCLIAVGSG